MSRVDSGLGSLDATPPKEGRKRASGIISRDPEVDRHDWIRTMAVWMRREGDDRTEVAVKLGRDEDPYLSNQTDDGRGIMVKDVHHESVIVLTRLIAGMALRTDVITIV